MLNSRVDKAASDDAADDALRAKSNDARLNSRAVDALARGSGIAVFVSIVLLLVYASFGGTNSWLSGALCGVFGLVVMWAWIVLRGDTFQETGTSANKESGGGLGKKAAGLEDVADASCERFEDIHDDRWALLESAEHLRELLDAQNAMIVKCTSSGIITFANQAFCRATGYSRDDLMGQKFHPTCVREDGVTFKGELPFASPGVTTQTLLLSRSRRLISWDVHTLPHSGDVRETQLVGHDVTDQVQRAQRLQSAREEAEAGNRAKSRFLAAMSHEIRTPMNGILGLTSLLKETPLDPEQKAYCESISQSGRNLLGLIDEILDFSKIEAGKISLSSEPFSLETCAQNAVELLASRAHEKKLELAWFIDPQVSGQIVGDASRVQQILLNLISNAIKFTDVGGVSLYGALSECGRNVEIVVADTGIGLSARECDTLFQEFEQTEAAVRRQSGGTGLGLAIGRKLARAMGGDIRVTSEVGRGTQFTFSMPLHRHEAASHDGGDQVDAHSSGWTNDKKRTGRRRILIVSDRVIERTAMMRVLRAHDADAVLTGGSDAIETIASGPATGRNFDRVIFDAGITCDVVDGVLQLLSGKGSRNAIVCVDASERSQLPAFLMAGCSRHLVRPVRPASLVREAFRKPSNRDALALVDDCGRGAEVTKASAPCSIGGDSPGLHAVDMPLNDDDEAGLSILLAEDNAVNVLIARRVIENAGHRATVVRNGSHAVQHMEKALRNGEAYPDLILMDIMMPEMDGVEATQTIKALFPAEGTGGGTAGDTQAENLVQACPPIIALTANAFVEDRKAYLEQGLDDYLSKPFEAADLTALIERWRGRRPGSTKAQKQHSSR